MFSFPLRLSCGSRLKLLPILVFSLVNRLVSAQLENFTVTARDPRIVYVGDWVDQDDGGHRFTTTEGSSMSFSFNGTAIYWNGVRNPQDGVASVFVDSPSSSVIIDASQGTVMNAAPIPAIVFFASGLDPSKEHTLNISYIGAGSLGGPYVEIYTLVFTGTSDGTAPIPSASSLPASADTPTTGTPDTVSQTAGATTAAPAAPISSSPSSAGNHASTVKGGIIGGVVGAVIAVIVITAGFCFFGWRRRRERRRVSALTPFMTTPASPPPNETSRGVSFLGDKSSSPVAVFPSLNQVPVPLPIATSPVGNSPQTLLTPGAQQSHLSPTSDPHPAPTLASPIAPMQTPTAPVQRINATPTSGALQTNPVPHNTHPHTGLSQMSPNSPYQQFFSSHSQGASASEGPPAY